MKSESYTIDGLDYEVKEQSMRILLPILQGDETKIPALILESCVYRDGVCIGDGVLDFGLSDYQALMEVANRVHGMEAPEDDEEKK